jgi:hypothetical protein
MKLKYILNHFMIVYVFLVDIQEVIDIIEEKFVNVN